MGSKLASLRRFGSFLPAILVLAVVGGLIGRGIYSADKIQAEYRVAARQAVADKDLEQAKFYYSRLVGAGDKGSEQDQLNWISILSASGDTEAAIDKLNLLAPDDSVGFPSAHLQKAKMLSAARAQPPGLNPEQLKQLAFHLRHGARDATVENDLLWGDYYLAIEQIDNAIERLESAASRKPEIWFDIANLYGKLGRVEDSTRASNRAEAYALATLEANPLDVNQRVRLLVILANQKKYDQVEALLSEGMRLSGDSPVLREMASNLVLMRMDQLAADDPDGDRKRISLLSESARLNPNNPNVYKMLNAFYAQSRTSEARLELRERLEAWITEGQSVPLAHFTLGNLLWLEKDQDGAVFHLEAALKLDPTLAIVANNLAWILCNSSKPNFERSEQLIQMAIETVPNNQSFQDTMGTVLFKQQKYAEALPYLEKVLPLANGEKKIDLHTKLAEVYEKLDRPKLAELHRKQLPPKAPEKE